MQQDDWQGLYAERWGKDCVPAATEGHQAKFARALIRRIYDHAVQEGWLRVGDAVLDPFAGVALGGLDAMRLGLDWTGIELEQKFVDWGHQNIVYWNNLYADKLPRWGKAVLVHGDSQRLRDILPERSEISLLVSSPPYAQSLDASPNESTAFQRTKTGVIRPHYCYNPDNLGNMRGDTFWLTARLVLDQAFALIRPGGHAIFVTKRFVREGAIIEFSQQWAQLCQACGFQLVHWHKAWLVEHNGIAFSLDGSEVECKTARKSFFRRLYEGKNPHNAIDWEDVLCFQKPLTNSQNGAIIARR